MESLVIRINTAEIAESAEMTKKERLNRITESGKYYRRCYRDTPRLGSWSSGIRL